MALLKNKTFAIVVCLISFSISGLIFTDKVFGLSSVSTQTTFSQPVSIPSPTNTSSNSPQAVNVSYLNSAGYLNAASSLSWSKLSSFPSSCSSGYYVSGVGLSLACSQLPSAATNYWTLSGNNLYNNSGSYIGIGNSSPSYKLDVSGDTRLNGNVGIGTTPNSSYPLNVSGKSYLYGNVGINTSPSTYALDVSGTINASNSFCINGSCKNTWTQSCSSGQYVTGVGASSLTCSAPSSAWSSITGFPSSCSSGSYVSGVGSSLACTVLPSAATNYWTLSGNNLYNNSGSYIGIGNSSPSYKLDVSGDTRLNGYVGVGTYPSTSYKLYVSGGTRLDSLSVSGEVRLSGKVGIGSGSFNFSSPNFDFEVTKGVNAGAYYQGNNLLAGWLYSPTGNGIHPSNYSSTVFIGQSGGYTSDKLSVYGNVGVNGDITSNGTIRGNSLSISGSKNFVIDHPLDPKNKQLVHSSLEGPEVGVYYRGEAQLENGKAIIELPSYFEALTRKENRTVLLTPFVESLGSPVSSLVATPAKEGKFSVGAIDQNNPSQKFYWEVKAVRADVAPLEVERSKVNEK